MKIGYLGAGAWGFCLASLLGKQGHEVTVWTLREEHANELNRTRLHPNLPSVPASETVRFTTSLKEALEGAEAVVESVTSAGLRPVCEQIKTIDIPKVPFILTSKGIEQNSGLILPDVVFDVWGEETRSRIGLLSGPSFSHDVIQGLPTSVVGAAFDEETRKVVCDLFTTPTFRVYPNADIVGVAYGGALKNIVAIACGIAQGLNLGASCLAALMTRGLHEMRKLAIHLGARPETLNGLSGMGDLCLTCGSTLSRNFRFGMYLAQGEKPTEAQDHVHMVVEGAYTCLSALQLSEQYQIPMPITKGVYEIVYNKTKPSAAVEQLMQRVIKEEHL